MKILMLIILSVCCFMLAMVIPIIVIGRETDTWFVFLIRKILPPLFLSFSFGFFIAFVIKIIIVG